MLSEAAMSHLQVHNGEAVPVRPADDGVEILKLGGQEGSEGSLQTHSPSLLKAQEVRTTNSSHVTRLRSVQGNEMQLMKRENKLTETTLRTSFPVALDAQQNSS